MIYSMIIYGTGYLDYMTFGFAMIGKKERKTFMTMNDNLVLNKKLNQPDYRPLIENKLCFNETFAEYLHRDWLNLERASPAEFTAFCQGRSSFFAKQSESFGGLGVQKISLTDKTDLEQLYHSLRRDKFDLAEETILQH